MRTKIIAFVANVDEPNLDKYWDEKEFEGNLRHTNNFQFQVIVNKNQWNLKFTHDGMSLFVAKPRLGEK